MPHLPTRNVAQYGCAPRFGGTRFRRPLVIALFVLPTKKGQKPPDTPYFEQGAK
ncbi:MAG TPA: hypothetical protein VK148_18590 [Xanthobacteraceae bacterium]|nr:hypothetical protein [Xanthobacteraceae bacterium]